MTKKRFGQFITPQNSPVQPERFRGFHTGADFETFPEEQSEAVQVKAVCSGKILRKGFVSGYGGLVVQQCQLESGPMTVVYGHLKLTSVLSNIGDNLHQGENLGLLGTGFTSETDGERKHLHLGLHRGTAIDLRGYVQTQEELSAWIDPCPLVCSE